MRVEDLTKFEGECPNIVIFGTYMDIRVPLTKKWKKIINERGDSVVRIQHEKHWELVNKGNSFQSKRLL